MDASDYPANVEAAVEKAMAAYFRRARSCPGGMRWTRRDPRPVWQKREARP